MQCYTTITAGPSRSGHKQHLIAVLYYGHYERMNFLLMRNSIDFIFVQYFFPLCYN